MSTFIESYQLVRGRWIEVLGRLLFLALATVAAFLVLAGVVFLAKLAFVMVPDSLGLNLLTMAFNLALTAIVGPVTVAYLYFLYEELKKTRTHHAAPASIRKWLVALSIFGAIVITALPFIVVLLVYALK